MLMRLNLSSSSVGFLLSLLLDLEEEGKMFLRNVGKHPADYTTLQPRRLALFVVRVLKSSGLAHVASVLLPGLSSVFVKLGLNNPLAMTKCQLAL
jgi:hypothetical protein